MKRWIALGLILIAGTLFLGCATSQKAVVWLPIAKATTGGHSELILNDEYFQAAHREIQNAKESIYLIAYLFLIYDYQGAYSNLLLEDLIDAREKAVDVHVILEYPKPEYIDEKGPANQKVYEKLKAAGIDVRFDKPERTTHSKVLIIDEETIIAGSHNYSFDGLKYNNEVSLLLKDRGKAKRLIKYFRQIQ